jgi:hypothetical protein
MTARPMSCTPPRRSRTGGAPRYAQMVIEGVIPVKPEKHRMRMQSIFAEGHAIHKKWQDWLGSMGSPVRDLALRGLW